MYHTTELAFCNVLHENFHTRWVPLVSCVVLLVLVAAEEALKDSYCSQQAVLKRCAS
jgi:hypothetical protein